MEGSEDDPHPPVPDVLQTSWQLLQKSFLEIRKTPNGSVLTLVGVVLKRGPAQRELMGSMDYNVNQNCGEALLSAESDGKLGHGDAFRERPPVTFEECQRYDKAVGLRLAYSLMEKFGSHERLPELLELVDSYQPPACLCALGVLWPGLDNVGLYQAELLDVLAAMVDDIEALIPELMDREEQDAFEALPDELVIYRGCGPHNVRGWSWSLSRDVARKFPYSNRYDTEVPLLLTARIPKSRAAALKLARQEQEIIVFDYPDAPSLRWTGEFLDAPKPIEP